MTVYVGALAPERVVVTIDNAELASSPLDLSTVTAVALDVRAPSQRFVWALTITSQTSTRIVGYHDFAEGDVGEAGNYKIMAQMTVPGGVRRAGPSVLEVREP